MVDVISAAPCFLVVCFQRKRRKPAFVHCHVLSVHSSNGVIHHTYIIIPTVMYHSSSPSLSQASRFNHSATLARMSTGGPATRSLLCTHPSKDGPGFATYSNRACSNHDPETDTPSPHNPKSSRSLGSETEDSSSPSALSGKAGTHDWLPLETDTTEGGPRSVTEGNHGLLASPARASSRNDPGMDALSNHACTIAGSSLRETLGTPCVPLEDSFCCCLLQNAFRNTTKRPHRTWIA